MKRIFKLYPAQIILSMFALGFAVYANSLHAGFQYDDYKIIVENPAIQHLQGLKFLWQYDPTRFLVHLSFAINLALSGLNVFPYHVVNVVLHIICALAVYYLLKMVLENTDGNNRYTLNEKRNIALFASVIFLVHPLQTESVTYIVQRSTVMASLFYVLALLFYISARRKNQNLYFVISLFFAFLGTVSKPLIVSLPLMIILIEFFCFGFSIKDFERRLKFIWPYFIVIFLVMIFIMLWRYGKITTGGFLDTTRETDVITRPHYFLTQLNVIVTYIFLLFFPLRQNLDYDFPIATNLFGFPTIFSLLILVGLFIFAIHRFKKQKYISFCLLWFFVALLPESSIFPLSDVIFEHRLYLPMVGFSLLVVVLIFKSIKAERKRTSLLVLIIFILSALTIRRNAFWANQKLLLEDTIAKSPHKARPVNNLADYYFRNGQFLLAEEQLKKAIQLEPREPKYRYHLGVVFERQGKFDDAKRMYEQATRQGLYKEHAEYFFSLGHIYHQENKFGEAEQLYKISLQLNDKLTDAYSNLGNLYVQQGKFDESIEMYKKTIEINPFYFSGYNGLATAYGMMEEFDKSIELYKRLIQIYPQSSLAYNNLGNVYVRKKDLVKAEETLKKALAINPQDIAAHRNIANVYYGLNQNERARIHMKETINLLRGRGEVALAEQLQKRYMEEKE